MILKKTLARRETEQTYVVAPVEFVHDLQTDEILRTLEACLDVHCNERHTHSYTTCFQIK